MTSKQYFDTVATEWDTMRQGFYPEAVRVIALAKARVIPGQTAVDVGAGSGFMTEALLNMELQVMAIDPSQAMLSVMRSKFRRYYGQVSYRVGSADALPINDNKFDYAFANMSLHHVENPAQAIQEMARIVKPGGKVVITDLDAHLHTFLREEHHDRWLGFERRTIAEWFAAAGLQHTRIGSICTDSCISSTYGNETAQVNIFLAIGIKA
jgi:ubiquinone/menaquinone biosynthesis C-methylase UbiE